MNASSGDDHIFLNRITAIVEANLNNEQFGVSELSGEMGMSRSMLYIKIKSVTKKSASAFISEIRLNKAMEMLKTTSLTVSEVAYEVGFGSPAYFNHCFHKHFGYPPGEAKKQSLAVSNSENNTELQLPHNKWRGIIRHKKLIFAFIGISSILLASYLVLNVNSRSPSTGKVNSRAEKSIIVLPFKNLSNEINNQYFVDGISEDILNNLTKITDLKVISRTSSEQFRASTLSSTEIARQMNVNYILEGSVRRQGVNVRISVQLIDARSDRHLWSENYDRQMKDIFAIQSDIAKNVASQLESILSPKEIEMIDKTYTSNQNAYNFYLEGRLNHRLRTKQSYEKSIECYNKALELDSNYCLAYAGLADTYVTSTWFGNYTIEEGITKSRAYALKALGIDKNLAEAHATLGAIATFFDYNYDMAEKELKLAMKINPGYSRGYHLYAQYLDVIRNKEGARRYLNKAIDLNPTDWQLRWFSYYLFLKDENYDEALKEVVNCGQLRTEASTSLMYFKIYFGQNNILKAVELYKRYMSEVSPEMNAGILDSIFAETGKEGVVKFMIEFELQRKTLWIPDIARYYAIINEKDSALTYLERGYESGRGDIVKVVGVPEFENLHSEPRFIGLIKKLNLTDYYFPE